MSEEIKSLVKSIGDEFAEFKKANDERLKAIEEKGYAPADLEQKVDEMSKGLCGLEEKQEKLTAAINRSVQGEFKSEKEEKAAQVKSAVMNYLRKGETAELKELSVGSDPNGGYTVFPAMGELIRAYEAEQRPFLQLANTVTINTDAWEAPADASNSAGSGWVGELDSRTETNTPTFKFKRIPVHELYALPILTTKIAEDSEYDIEGWLQMKVAEIFAETKSAAFHTGAASNVKPRGFLTYSDGTTGWEDVEQIFSGSTSGFTSDKIIDMQQALKDVYQANASWLARRSTIAELRKLKSPVTTSGAQEYLIVPDFANAARATMLGSPIIADPDMPAVTSGALSLAYGDWKRAYTIVNRRDISVLRDPYSTKGKVEFYTTARSGGDVTNFEAFKIMDNATS